MKCGLILFHHVYHLYIFLVWQACDMMPFGVYATFAMSNANVNMFTLPFSSQHKYLEACSKVPTTARDFRLMQAIWGSL